MITIVFVSPLVTQISWTNHLLIMSSSKSAEERHFCLSLCVKEHYSKRELERRETRSVIEFTEERMGDFTIEEMLAMQQALQEKYKDKWEPIGPEAGKHKLLWMLGEVGEVIDIIKKNGDKTAVEDAAIRQHLVEEMADVLMYYNDVLLCYGISGRELKEAYTAKFEKNMTRW